MIDRSAEKSMRSLHVIRRRFIAPGRAHPLAKGIDLACGRADVLEEFAVRKVEVVQVILDGGSVNSLIFAQKGQTGFSCRDFGPCSGHHRLRLPSIRPVSKESLHPITVIRHLLNSCDSILLRETVPPKSKRPQELTRFLQRQSHIFKR